MGAGSQSLRPLESRRDPSFACGDAPFYAYPPPWVAGYLPRTTRVDLSARDDYVAFALWRDSLGSSGLGFVHENPRARETGGRLQRQD